ncbi:MAG: GTPase domain-containing protein [Mycobacteriales bacterium]
MAAAGGAPSIDDLSALREALTAVTIDETSDHARELRSRLLAELEGHIMPRVSHPHAPIVVAVTGPTGGGKSTLVNGLAGQNVSPSGALRPTTRTPMLAHRPEDARWFPGERRRVPAWAAMHTVTSVKLPPGVALMDTPDIGTAGDDVAGPTHDLLASADVWLFVTTATRYADAIPWQMLLAASGRGADLAVVLDRVQAEAAEPVKAALQQLLQRYGLLDAALIVVAETPLVDNRLPPAAVAPVRSWLESLAAGGTRRAGVLQRAIAGAVAALGEPLTELIRLAGGDTRLRQAAQAVGSLP